MNNYCDQHEIFARDGEECPKCHAEAIETAYHDLREVVGRLLSLSLHNEDGLTRSAPDIVWSELSEAYNRCK